MNESMNFGSGQENQEEEDNARCADYLERHPTPVFVQLESSPDFESLVADFEKKHSLDELLEIGQLSAGLFGMFSKDRDVPEETIEWLVSALSPEDAQRYRARTSAKQDLKPIVEALKSHSSGREAYMKLSRAVGMISGNEVVHDR